MNSVVYLQDHCRSHDEYLIRNPQRINSKLDFFNDVTGERNFEPLHNKTVIAGAGLTLQKLFNLDSSCLNNTPTYDEVLGLEDAASANDYPTTYVTSSGTVIGSVQDESQRYIIGYCVGSGGAGLEVSDVFEIPYASWITPENLIPFMYPLQSSDMVDTSIYKGKKIVEIEGQQPRAAYYFKEFSNTPKLVQNYVSTVNVTNGEISPRTVYSNTALSDRAQTFVELSLKITKDDCREFYTTHNGLEQAKINQVSLVYGYKKKNSDGVNVFQQIRPFSICNFPTQILSDKEMSISIVYTLYC